MKLLPTLEAIAAIVSFLLIFAVALGRQLALSAGANQKTVDALALAGILLFFTIFAFACIGLMLHVFVVLQARIGNSALPMVRFLTDHETGVTFGIWGFLGLGSLIALPAAWIGLSGFQMPLGKSQGVLVADIGMTIEQVKTRSTLKIKDPRHMGDGSYLGVEDRVFEYRIGDSAVRFPDSRYYWLSTPVDDTHIKELNIGITPRKIPKPELESFQHRLQAELNADGWMPGHYLAKSEETVTLWGGQRTTGDGRYWLKGNTLLIFETSRMDEEKRDEPPGSGEFILNLAIRPKSDHADLVFERSAWTP
jgi:hypothetical protein